MRRPKLLRAGILVTFLIIGLTVSFFLYTRLASAPSHSPIPAATLAAFQPGIPIENPDQAFVAAQVYLGATRLHALGEILPYDAQTMGYAEATARTTQPG